MDLAGIEARRGRLQPHRTNVSVQRVSAFTLEDALYRFYPNILKGKSRIRSVQGENCKVFIQVDQESGLILYYME